MDIKQLALALAGCENEVEVISLLEAEGLWDSPANWRSFGDNDNNWSTIGNQQSEADAALVEKIVNSVDALLMKECMIRGIEPTSDEAPRSIATALENFFGITGGKIQNLTETDRTGLAQKNIILAATGSDNVNPNIVIVDRGEGQSPKRMPDTILSINKSNKLKVPFVQGKFNMGGTGALCFCGEHNFQLVISRRCPDIPKKDDETHSLWGVTIVRRERPTRENGLRSSKFTYLTDVNHNIMSFESEEGLEIIPTSKGTYDTMEFGMFCKMYEYKLPSGLRSNINMRLYYRLSMLLPNLAYPVYLDECRTGKFKAHTYHRTLSGLNVRLSDQLADGKDSNIEAKIPVSFMIEGQKVDASVYVFKKKNGTGKNGDEKVVDLSQYRGSEGILLTQNGQTHGSYDRKFYSRNAVQLSYLAEHLLTIVDCTGIDEATREELFMNSRDRTRSSTFATKLESFLEEYLKENAMLKEIQQRRREEAISDKLDDAKPLEDVLTSVFKSSSVLSRLFVLGKKLQNPTNLGPTPQAEAFVGKYNPTYFTIYRKKADDDTLYVKEAQLERKFRVRFKTDANNDFFTREKYQGEYSLTRGTEQSEDHILHLHNGIATLNVELPEDAKVGDVYRYKFTVTDTNVDRDFVSEFEIHVVENQETTGGNGRRTPPDGEGNDRKALSPTGISLPTVTEVYKEEWEEYGFTKESALCVKKIDDVYDFFVNMDNIHLQTEIKPIAKNEGKMRLLKARYKYSMVLLGLGVLGYHDNHKEQEDAEVESPEEEIKRISEMVSPVILPIIDVLGDDMSDILG